MTVSPARLVASRATARGRDDRALASAAAGGDGRAFAELYDRHEHRAYNLAYRITGSEHDAADATQEAFVSVLQRLPSLEGRDLDFGNYLLTSVRHASYDTMSKARKADPADELPEAATPVGAAAARAPEEDPDRSVLLAAQQEEIRAANAMLPPRQREALALREISELSYDEIAEQLGMNRNSVAQLISRARIGLRDALRKTALANMVGQSPDCERALPLIAMRDDRQLAEGDADLGWLRTHLASCERCALGGEAMAEAGASYRAWALVPVLETLRRTAIAHAGERIGHDWSAVADAPRPAPRRLGRLRGGHSPHGTRRRVRRGLGLGMLLTLLALLGLFAASVEESDRPVFAETELAVPQQAPDRPAARAKAVQRSTTARGAKTAPSAAAVREDAAPGVTQALGSEPAAPARALRRRATAPRERTARNPRRRTTTPKAPAPSSPAPPVTGAPPVVTPSPADPGPAPPPPADPPPTITTPPTTTPVPGGPTRPPTRVPGGP